MKEVKEIIEFMPPSLQTSLVLVAISALVALQKGEIPPMEDPTPIEVLDRLLTILAGMGVIGLAKFDNLDEAAKWMAERGITPPPVVQEAIKEADDEAAAAIAKAQGRMQ